jgi:hypothetical protein
LLLGFPRKLLRFSFYLSFSLVSSDADVEEILRKVAKIGKS